MKRLIIVLCLFSPLLHAGFPGYVGWYLSNDDITGEPKLLGSPIFHLCPEPIILDFDKSNHSDPNIRKKYKDEVRSRSKKIRSCVDEKNKKSDIEDKRKQSLMKIYKSEHFLWSQGYRNIFFDWNKDGVISNEFFRRDKEYNLPELNIGIKRNEKSNFSDDV